MTNQASSNTSDLSRHRIFSLAELGAYTRDMGACEYLVNGLLPEQSLSLAVGRSNIGKSPLLYQLALCVASGASFLGRKVKQGPVLILDAENTVRQGQEVLSKLEKHLGVPPGTPGLHYWNLNTPGAEYGTPGHGVEDFISAMHPAPVLVVLDPIYAFYPTVEKSAEDATRAWQSIRKLMAKYGCSFLCVHHLRKDDPKAKVPGLEDAESPHSWLQQSRGSSAMINGTDVRIGIDKPSSATDAALLLRGFVRTEGELPTLYINRVCDEDGEPLGYDVGAGPDPLSKAHDRKVYLELPQCFRHKEVKLLYGGSSANALSTFLAKCVSGGLLTKLAPSPAERFPRYQKTRAPAPSVN